MLNSLTTKNFKKLNDHHFEFTDGLNVIVGDNAAGKTTLTYAIAFALFGVRAIPSKAENIPTWGTKDTEVKLSVGPYLITRTLKNCTVAVEKTGAIEAVGNSPCSAYIEANITGLDYKGFKMFNWSGQDETAALLTIGATQLQRDIEKFSGVQFIDNIIKKASKDLALIDNELDGAEVIELAEEYVERDRLEADAGDLTDKAEGVDWALGATSDRVAEAEADLAEGKKTAKSRNTLEVGIADCTSRIESAREAITELEAEKGTLAEAVWDGDETLSGVKSQLKQACTLNEEHRSKSEQRQRLTEQLRELRSEEEADIGKQSRLDELTAAERAASDAASCAASVANVADSIVAGLRESLASGVCSKCNRPFDGYDEAEALRELKIADTNVALAGDEMAVTSEALKAARSALARSDKPTGAAARIPAVNAQIAELAQWLLDNELQDVAKLEDTLDRLTSEKAEAAAAQETAAKLQRLLDKAIKNEADAMSEQSAYKATLKTLPDPIDLEELQSQITALSKEVNDLKLEAQSLKQQSAELNRKLKEVSTYITESLAYNAEVERLSKESALLTSFVKFLRDSRVTFLASVWDQILNFASGFVNDTTQGKISAIIKTDDGFEFCEDGIYAPAEAASGAQKGFIGVAMRIAMAESLRVGMPTIILDEPSAAMREGNAMQLSGGLLGQEQVLMITHRESDQVSGSSIIEVG